KQDNATVFGDFLQGPPVGGGNPGIGSGKTHNISGGATYTLTSNMVLDSNVGWVRMNSGVEQSDIGQNKGLDILGIPGTNGNRSFEGGMPLFDISGYTGLGTTESYMPYFRSDDQMQAVLNLNWVKGSHNFRTGTDVYWQAMNHTQPEFDGTSQGARGGFDYGSGPTLLRGGPSGNNFNSFATFLLGLPTQIGRVNEVDAPFTTRNIAYSFYVRDQWQVKPKLTVSYGTRWEYFPVPTRAHRGLERYNPQTNMMEIGGVGSVPEDLGVKVSKTMFAPRLGMAYRFDEKTVLRAGYGVTNDPFALARPMRTNHPVLLNLLIQAPTSFGWTSRTADGIPAIANPDLGNGIIPIPGDVAAFTLPTEFNRGKIHSWNVSFQRELYLGFVGEAAYVATKQVDQLGYRELNWSPINGGQAGRQLAQAFGRRAQTRIVTPIGDSTYHALQTQLNRRFANGFQLGMNYTYSRSKGIAGAPDSDNLARIQIPEFYHLNYGISDLNRPHAFNVTNITELPFGPGRRWLNERGVVAALAGGWQVNNTISFFSGTPISVTASGASLNAPESAQRADLVGTPQIIGTGAAERGQRFSYFDPSAFAPVTEARFGTAPWNFLQGPGFWSWNFGLFREFRFLDSKTLQFRFEGFNILDSPRFNNPGSNVSNLQRNADGSIRSLNGFTEITSTSGGSERQLRLGLRFGF
nr:TonB-dependent receptor [Acidobacteriota bacterium]